MSLALQLPPRFLAPALPRTGSLALIVPLAGLLGKLLNDWLLHIRGGGRKHSHASVRKRNTDPQKLFKPQKSIDNCKACGRPKLMGHMCLHCVTYLTKVFKGTKRVGLDRPTIDSEGLLVQPKEELGPLPEDPSKSYRRSVEYRERKYRQLKEEYEAEKRLSIRMKNARRTQLNLPLLNDEGQLLPDAPQPSQATEGLFGRMRRLLPGRMSSV